MRKLGFAMVVALLCALLPATSTQAGSSTPVTFPSSPKGLKAPVKLPKQLDPVPAYVPQAACQPGTPAGVAKLRALTMKTYGVGGVGNTARQCSEGVSEHADGRAWDWMVHVDKAKEKAAAADFLAWLTRRDGENARRLGIMYVIYNKKIWAVYRAKDGWRPSSGHRDHIHLSFSWNGARAKTSFWTGAVQKTDHGPCRRFAGQPAVVRSTAQLTPCPTPAALVKTSRKSTVALGSRASTVKTGQRLVGARVTGVFDSATRKAVLAHQRAHDLPVTGVLDVPTWASLLPKEVTKDVASGYSATKAATHGLKNHSGTTLKERSSGAAVRFLQQALSMKAELRNGFYGPKTVAAVKARQKSLGRPQTGTWTGADWKAIVG